MNRQLIKLLVLSLVLLIAACSAVLAYAQGEPPPPPQAFYGAVEAYGRPAAPGTLIEARGVGVLTKVPGNPLTITVGGQYGGPTYAEAKLVVQGEVPESTPIEFYVNGMKAECALPGGDWQDSHPFSSGVTTHLNLRVGAGLQYKVYIPFILK
jgi:hypothetical protein